VSTAAQRALRRSQFASIQAAREGRVSVLKREAPEGFGRHQFRIPEQDFYALAAVIPALISQDPDQSRRAWDAFEKSPLSEPYRVSRVSRGVIRK
jgi:hypothetical protein